MMILKVLNLKKSAGVMIILYSLLILAYLILSIFFYSFFGDNWIISELNIENICLLILSFIIIVLVIYISKFILDLIELVSSYPLMVFLLEENRFNLYNSNNRIFSIQKDEIAEIRYFLNNHKCFTIELYKVGQNESVCQLSLANNFFLKVINIKLYKKRNMKNLQAFFIDIRILKK